MSAPMDPISPIDSSQAGLLDLLADAAVVVDDHGRIRFWNAAAAQLYGIPPEEARGCLLDDVAPLPPSALDGAHGPWRGRVAHQRSSGALLAVDVTTQALPASDGAPRSLLAIMRAAFAPGAEAAGAAGMLLMHERGAYAARLESLLDHAPIGIALLDRELRYQHINSLLARMNGLPIAMHLGRTLREVLPTVADEVEPRFRQVMETDAPILDHEIQRRSLAEPESVRTWQVSYFPVRAVDGRVIGGGTLVVDITRQRQLEDQLRADARRSEAILELMDDALIACQPDGTIVTLNRRARQLLGLAATETLPTIEAIGAYLRAALLQRDGTPISAGQGPFTRLQRGEHFQDLELHIAVQRGAHDVWLSMSGAPVLDAQGAPMLHIMTVHDITALKRAEEALREYAAQRAAQHTSADGAV